MEVLASRFGHFATVVNRRYSSYIILGGPQGRSGHAAKRKRTSVRNRSPVIQIIASQSRHRINCPVPFCEVQQYLWKSLKLKLYCLCSFVYWSNIFEVSECGIIYAGGDAGWKYS
jgi:hypothetical protein